PRRSASSSTISPSLRSARWAQPPAVARSVLTPTRRAGNLSIADPLALFMLATAGVSAGCVHRTQRVRERALDDPRACHEDDAEVALHVAAPRINRDIDGEALERLRLDADLEIDCLMIGRELGLEVSGGREAADRDRDIEGIERGEVDV